MGKIKMRSLAVIILSFMLAACGAASGGSENAGSSPKDIGKLSYPANTTVVKGETATIKPDITKLVQGTGKLTYDITSGAVDGITINENTGVITVDKDKNVAAKDYTLGIRVRSNDGGEAATNVTIEVKAKAGLSGTLSYPANTTVVKGETATIKPDITKLVQGTGTITYAVTSPSPIPAGININTSTGVITVAADAAVKTHSLTITVSSTHGGKATTNVTIEVKAKAGLSGTLSYPDTTVVTGKEATIKPDITKLVQGTGTITYAVTGGTTSGITIDENNGEITVATGVAVGEYDLTITVSSTHVSATTLTATAKITVVIPLSGTFSYPANTTVLKGEKATIKPDITGLNAGTGNIRYSITSDPSTLDIFQGTNTGEIYVSPHITAGEYKLTITVSSTHGGEATTTAKITVSNNEIGLSSTLSYPDTTVVTGKEATIKPDITKLVQGTGTITYAVTSPSQLPTGISINTSTGAIAVAADAAVKTHSLTITVSSTHGGKATTNVTIEVKAKAGLSGTLSYPDTTVVTGKEATIKPDITKLVQGTGTITYAVTGGTTSGITIDENNGEITVATGVAVGEYDLTITVSSTHVSATTLTATAKITVVIPLSGTFSYPANTTVLKGEKATIKPDITGLNAGTGNIRYSITSDPSTLDIFQGTNTGEIYVSPHITAGEYKLTITVSSTHGGEATTTAKITVSNNEIGLSSTLSYPDTTVVTGKEATIKPDITKLVQGTGTITYAVTSPSQLPTGISINTSTGAIAVAADAAVKTHSLTITVSSTHVSAITLTATAKITVATPIFVDAAANDNGDGSSWSKAYNNLSTAIKAINDNKHPDAIKEIWIAKGIYKPSLAGVNPDAGIASDRHFILPNNQKVYGGFASGATASTDRDPKNNAVILSGDINGDDSRDSSGNIINNTDNTHHVIIVNGSFTAELHGVTISGGNAVGASIHMYGGGIYASGSNVNLTLSNVTISDNTANDSGGGIYASGSNVNLTLSNVTISGNTAKRVNYKSGGGGIYANTNANLTLSNVTISDNTANDSGGGIHADGGATLTLSNVTISGNTANSDSYRSGGGGIYANTNAHLTLSNVNISGNTAKMNGGGYLAYQGATTTINNATFSGNIAENVGGGFSTNNAGNTTMINVTISGNKAIQGGGGMYLGEGSFNLVNTIVWNTYSNINGIYIAASPKITIANSIIEGRVVGTNLGNNKTDDPKLAVTGTPSKLDLKNNGGFVDTIAITAGSPAIDAGIPVSHCEYNSESTYCYLKSGKWIVVGTADTAGTKTADSLELTAKDARGWIVPGYNQDGTDKTGETKKIAIGAYNPEATTP